MDQQIHIAVDQSLKNSLRLENFFTSLKCKSDQILERIPSDGSFFVKLMCEGTGFKIALRMKSTALNILEVGLGQSPFEAFDHAMDKMDKLLRLWAINRYFQE